MARPRRAATNLSLVAVPGEGEISPQSPPALTAAAERATRKKSDRYQRLNQTWQSASLDYYDTVGEAWYAAQFYARAMANLRLFVGKINDQGEVEELKEPTPDDSQTEKSLKVAEAPAEQPQPTQKAQPPVKAAAQDATPDAPAAKKPEQQAPAQEGLSDDDQAALDALDRVQDPSGGRSQLLASWGRLMFLIGEGYLTVTMDEDADEEKWEFLSNEELRKKPSGGYVRYTAPSQTLENLDEVSDDSFEPIGGKNKKAVVYRMWRRHPRYSALADGPMKGVLDLFEELKLLEKAVRARARSRLAAAGILLIPQEITFGAQIPPGQDPDPTHDPVMKRLQLAMSTAIQQPGSAAGVVPIVIRGPYEYLDRVQHIKIDPGDEDYPEAAKQENLIQRIAIGLDMPKEILTGMSDANHWSAWQIDDQTWRAHLEPMAKQLVEDFTSVYLQPYLKGQDIGDYRLYVIGYDEAGVVSHPDKAADAKALYSDGAIGYKALRDANAFTEADAMDQEEYQTWLALQFKDATMLPGPIGDQVRAAKEQEAQRAHEQQMMALEKQAQLKPGEEGPPQEPGAEEKQAAAQKPVARVVRGSAAELLGAARLTHRRAREKAGARLRTKVRKNAQLEAMVASCDTGAVASTLGPATCASYGSAEALVAGAGAEFSTMAIADYGLDEAVARRIALLIESHAAKTLWETEPEALPAQLGPYLERVL